MKELKSVSESELREKTQAVVKNERQIGIEVLEHLREIDARKSFALWGYSSLYEYCIEELKYSRGCAHRRITSMKLLREIPELEPKIQSGELNVATLSQAHSFFRQENSSLDEKKEILKDLEGKSSDQAEKHFRSLSPELAKPEKKRRLNDKQSELQFTVSNELLEKLERLQTF
jgi:hypothetical protein